MKVLLVNGSPNKNGCTYLALCEVAKQLEKEGIDSEIFYLGSGAFRDCIACYKCRGKNRCIFNDDPANELIEKAEESDGFIFACPVYYAHPNGRLLSILDRAFYAGKSAFVHKPGASLVTARRAGTTASLDAINKYFGISEMPLISSSYWNMVYGPVPELVQKDQEGLQTMRNLAKNMAWILKCIDLGKNNGIPVPEKDSGARTNFNLAD